MGLPKRSGRAAPVCCFLPLRCCQWQVLPPEPWERSWDPYKSWDLIWGWGEDFAALTSPLDGSGSVSSWLWLRWGKWPLCRPGINTCVTSPSGLTLEGRMGAWELSHLPSWEPCAGCYGCAAQATSFWAVVELQGAPVPSGGWEYAPSLPWNTGQELSGQPAWQKAFSPAAGTGISWEVLGTK